MIICHKCNQTINDGEEIKKNSKTLCEDCYIDTLLPPVQKSYFENDSSFMQRLNNSYIAHPQTFH